MMTISDECRTCSNSPAITVQDTQCLAKFYEKNEDYRDIETDYDGHESLNKKIHFHIGDITDFKVDAIVCSTQTDLNCLPYGIHKQVIRRAGARYEESCRQVGHCNAGKAFITQGYDLQAKYIIHTAGPSPDTTLSYDERKLCLRESYSSCLEIVKDSPDITTVAFPCLGSGGAGLQLSDAITTAVTTIREWLETDNNITHVDSIILVMYDENQWNEYYTELFKAFPYGKDLAGIDLESLDCVDERTLLRYLSQTAVHSNILCFQYKKSAARHINRHFHSLVNTLHRDKCTRHEPLDRHRNCATFLVTAPYEHRVIMYLGPASLTLEVQVIFYNENSNNIQTLCERVETAVTDYLLRNLENVVRFKEYLRCNNSSWGDLDGMVNVQRLKTRMPNHSAIQCRHRKSSNTTTHTVNIAEIARFWISQDQGSLSSFHPEPGEHDEIGRESEDSISWRSIASSSSSGSGGNPEHKQDNIHSNTSGAGRVPVEHSDETPANAFGKIKNFIKSKFQVLTKSQKESEGTGQADEQCLSSNYQPFDDSLHEGQITLDQRRTEGNELNKGLLSKHNTRNAVASEQRSTKPGQTTGSDPYGQTGNRPICPSDDACKAEEKAPSSNYQPLDDSLLEVGRITMYQCTERNEMNIQLRSKHPNTRNAEQASEQQQCTIPSQTTGSNLSSQTRSEPMRQTSTGSVSNRISTGSEQSSGASAGSGRSSRTSSGFEHIGHTSCEHAGNCECRQYKREGSTLSSSSELTPDTPGACGFTNYFKSDYSFSSDTTLNDKTLLNIARLIGNRETQLGLELNLGYACIQRIKSENAGDATMQAFCILREWKIRQRRQGSIQTLLDAMARCSIDTTSLDTT